MKMAILDAQVICDTMVGGDPTSITICLKAILRMSLLKIPYITMELGT
jgi:hypothetical protein